MKALVPSWSGIQLLGSQRINDVGQILATVQLPTGERRYAILHPGTAPMLALDFRQVRGSGPRWQLPREPDGTVPFRIVGGEPGQPTALFVKLGVSYFYVDGTLGLFDGRQTFEMRLPIPASLAGLDFDVAAGALDSQFGILRSLDLAITFR